MAVERRSQSEEGVGDSADATSPNTTRLPYWRTSSRHCPGALPSIVPGSERSGASTDDASEELPVGHSLLLMTQEVDDLDSLVRKRIRALRVAQGWSLDELARRANLSQSSLSRIENGQRRLALDQLVTLARALDTTLDQLVETASDDVVTSAMVDNAHGQLRWTVKADPGVSVVRQRITEPPPDNPARMRAHPGREWLVVLSGTAILMLGHQRFRIETNQAAEFPTMMPHAIGTAGGPCEIIGIFDRDAGRGHRNGSLEPEA